MKRALKCLYPAACALLLLCGLVFPAVCFGGNDVLGEIHFEGKSSVARTSGVWIDGEYVGYLKELNGSKKVMLLPGQHTVVIRQDGYKDFTQEVTLRPGQRKDVDVFMVKAVTGPTPAVTSTVKISATPSRAAVFVDGQFIGHAAEFDGIGRALLVAPGKHQIRLALPGYESFEADINPQPDQKVEIKTDLLKSSVPINDALLAPGGNSGENNAAPVPAAGAVETQPGAMASPQEK